MEKVVLDEKFSIERNITWVVTDESRKEMMNLAYILGEKFPDLRKRPIRMRVTIEALE